MTFITDEQEMYNHCKDFIKWVDEKNASKQTPIEYQIMSKQGDGSILSIRRISDNQSFSIDEYTEQGKIVKFIIDEGGLMNAVCEKTNPLLITWYKLSELQKATPKPVLFTTHDGYSAKEGDTLFYINNDKEMPITEWVAEKYNDEKQYHHHEIKYFSTQEAAQTFVLENKPLLSLNDLLSVWGEGSLSMKEPAYYKDAPLYQKFIKVAKSKL